MGIITKRFVVIHMISEGYWMFIPHKLKGGNLQFSVNAFTPISQLAEERFFCFHDKLRCINPEC